MEIVPVLDLMNHVVVHGIQGNRREYQPVESLLAPGAEPLDIARALKRETRCQSMYLADLDAIQGRGHHLDLIKDLAAELDLDLWVDAGVARAEQVAPILSAGAAAVILGSETLAGLDELSEICRCFSPGQLILSLDLKAGQLISPIPELSGLTPPQALEQFSRFNLKQFILLTLDGVGTAQGPDIPLLSTALTPFPHLRFITGGGVKTPDHLNQLSSLGLDGVLLATSLHKGWITQNDLTSPTLT